MWNRWWIVCCAALALCGALPAAPLRVCATTPDLGDLARQVGGDEVAVTVFVKGPEDPHFLQARPSFTKALSEADLLVVMGLELESGWVPALLAGSRNRHVQPGQPGYLDAAQAIVPRHEADAGDRGAGHTHAAGNPHYLLDPVNGMAVAAWLCQRLGELRPAARDGFELRHQAWRQQLASALVGPELAARHDAAVLAGMAANGLLASYLAEAGEKAPLGGWLGALQPYAGSRVIDDHDLWGYFTARFGLRTVAHLEPKPGVTPSTRHLGEVVALVRSEQVRVLLTAGYFPARHGEWVAAQAGLRRLPMCHQTGARPEATSYLAMVDYNVRQVVEGLRQP